MALPFAAISLIISVVYKIVGIRHAKKETIITKGEIKMDEKPWYASKTLWGVFMTVLSFLSVWVWGTTITEDEKSVIIDSLTVLAGTVGVLFGSVLAIYGRIKASKTLK